MAKSPRKPGRLGNREKIAIELITAINPEASYDAIAKILNRRKSTIADHITAARDMLRFAAPQYLELHMKAASIAAADGNAGPAQWALERIEQAVEGETVRVVEAPAQRYDTGRMGGGGGLTVNVGLAISQVAQTPPPAPPRALTEPRTYATFPVEQSHVGVSLLDATLRDSDE